MTRTGNTYCDVRMAAGILRSGGVVALPTETVYGLGANALNATAVARIFEIKERPRFDPLIVHVGSVDQARQVVGQWPDAADELARHFWPGPLTMVLGKSDDIPDIVTSGLPTVAVRMPDHPLALSVIDEAGLPIAAPSANKFGCISPTTSQHVRRQLGEDVDMVLDGGPCHVGIESTIVALTEESPVLLRAGGTPPAAIEEVVGPIRQCGADESRPTAPGQCPRHYAPRTPLILKEDATDLPVSPQAGLIVLQASADADRFKAVEVLSPSGNLQEAAAGLFAAMHRLDAMDLDYIVATKVPDTGLGLAINDRLRRAAHRTHNVPMHKEPS
ncbi:MAG: L-threonylcarbamoyladenylate synthase [Phycisphaerae bacterium]